MKKSSANAGSRHLSAFTALGLILLTVLGSAACNPLYYVGIKLVYKRADLPQAQIIRNASYDPLQGPFQGSRKQQLDLFVPAGRGFPTVVFVHGGNWTAGDRSLKVGGADVYGNIGRFLASHGIGAAIMSYRLIPSVDWRTQATDVPKAIAWVFNTIPVYGGRSDALFVMGHSAGAQLAMRAAFDTAALAKVGVPRSAIRGLIAVSGAGYDMADQTTYALGKDPEFYAKRFRLGPGDTDWQQQASPIGLVNHDVPPSLLMYAGGDTAPLERQTQLLFHALDAAGATTTMLEIPGLSHTRIVPTLSRDDRQAGAAVVRFITSVMADAAVPYR